ncbi:hypothetical protein HID58_074957 [Brassica napus]|uniref:Uncharacterized protein n=1 Tax=Brassica napus TaxID=3708 RepID=A0ABQ7YI89_BRANA|nr:hypothetical protein HID58_074957 [Brassica napus]
MLIFSILPQWLTRVTGVMLGSLEILTLLMKRHLTEYLDDSEKNLSTVMTSRRRILPSPASPVSSPSLTLILHNDNLYISNEDDL